MSVDFPVLAAGPLHVPADTLKAWPNARFGSNEDQGIVVNALGFILTSAYQPIFDRSLSGPVGGEALLRASCRNRSISPERVFDSAAQSGCLVDFDRLCRTLHLMNYVAFRPVAGSLFLNVHPQLMIAVEQHGETFERILLDQGCKPGDVVLEILEAAIPDAMEAKLVEAVANYRRRGYRVAIDDFGRHHANLDRLWRLSADVVKLDRDLIQRAASDVRLRRGLPKLVELMHELDATVVIEGIETQDHLAIALDSGCDLLQGYFLGEPRYVKEG